MEATAKLRFIRLSPRRARLVGDAIRGKNVTEALNILEFMNNKPSKVIKKVLQSAIANANNKEGMDTESLYVMKLCIDEGPMWKRYIPRAMGRATLIRKKTSHINIVVSDGFKFKGKKRKISASGAASPGVSGKGKSGRAKKRTAKNEKKTNKHEEKKSKTKKTEEK